ncbi:TlpA family protein disulfide reductase [Shewanella donghaensis]|uniref:TlpA family protein disulfide reductase n=1 Tax=Shewanella donghaensis TaxID=238836 RepID=UPI001D042D0D|nr:TlpA disulfide reductase family protein [Shewanella donghaensis]
MLSVIRKITRGFIIMLGLFTFVMSANISAEQAPPKFSKANDFTLNDASGTPWSLKAMAGKPVVIHFWATWCPYCKKLQPGLERIRIANQDTDLQMIAISFNEDEAATPAKVLTDRGIGMKTLIEGDKVAQLYGVKGTPTTVFINRAGDIVWVSQISDPDSPKLTQAVEYLLSE